MPQLECKWKKKESQVYKKEIGEKDKGDFSVWKKEQMKRKKGMKEKNSEK